MITFIPRDKVSKNWIIIAPILSIVFTIFFGLLIFTFLGYNPLETLYQIFVSPFSRIDRISDILVKACPLIIIGTGLMLCFKSNVWNIGAEGQFILGRSLANNPKVAIFSQPTWGVDIGAATAIRQKLLDLSQSGKAVILISQDLEEIFELSDKICVINEGVLSEIFDVRDITATDVGLLAKDLPRINFCKFPPDN